MSTARLYPAILTALLWLGVVAAPPALAGDGAAPGASLASAASATPGESAAPAASPPAAVASQAPEGAAGTPELGDLPVVDRVVVRKAARRMVLMHGGNVVREYPIRLGLNPVGQKQRSGDFRTPEGSYRLERRNPRSEFFLSMKVSYPSAGDIRYARVHHWDTGGSIMIHGLPNVLKHSAEYYQRTDWTDGCIAVSNADMVEVWMLTPDDTPIDILP